MSDLADDELRAGLEDQIGKPMSNSGPAVAPDEVNLPMIRHWVDALDDRNPVYLDAQRASARFGGIVAPPAMLQTWTMGRPRIEGLAERGGAANEIPPDSALGILATAGYVGTLATNSELEFTRYLQLGDRLESTTELESISERKQTGLGFGYFVSWVTRYLDADGGAVGQQSFRIFKFDPTTIGSAPASDRKPTTPAGADTPGAELPAFELDVTPAVIVAGAIASRDFMPVHHDRNYATSQGAPDIFMNILTTNGYVSRYVTDWAGPESVLRSIAIRLGAPAIPGKALRFTGNVAGTTQDGDEQIVEVKIRVANELGNHATGLVTLALPAGTKAGG